jgi:hypothetical protein
MMLICSSLFFYSSFISPLFFLSSLVVSTSSLQNAYEFIDGIPPKSFISIGLGGNVDIFGFFFIFFSKLL